MGISTWGDDNIPQLRNLPVNNRNHGDRVDSSVRARLPEVASHLPQPQIQGRKEQKNWQGCTKMSAWASEHQRPPLRVLTSTRNALSPVWSPSEAVSSPAPSSLPRCTEP